MAKSKSKDNRKKGITALRNKKRRGEKKEEGVCATSGPCEQFAEDTVSVEGSLEPSFEEVINSVDSLLRRLSPKPEIQTEIFKINPEVIAHAKWVYDNFTEKVAV